MRKIKFCRHAEAKFRILKEHGFSISRKQVITAVKNADKIERARKNRIIFQKKIDDEHVLRVICEKAENKIMIVTFYPGRRKYYEN